MAARTLNLVKRAGTTGALNLDNRIIGAELLALVLGESSSLSTLTSLSTANCSLGAAGIQSLLGAMWTWTPPEFPDDPTSVGTGVCLCPGLTELNLSQNNLTDSGDNITDGSRALCEVIANYPSLRTLNLSGNNLTTGPLVDETRPWHGRGRDYAAVVALSAALEQSTSVQSLNISDCLLDPEGAKILAPGLLAASRTLTALDVSKNFMRESTELVAHALAGKQRPLESLNWSKNQVDPELGKKMVTILKDNKQLHELVFGGDGKVGGGFPSRYLGDMRQFHL
jgi:Leucine-rich repeat (LRR) protein